MSLSKPSIPFICEKCRTSFEPQDGGICSICGRVLCRRHLLGWDLTGFYLSKRKGQPICVECREKEKRKRKGKKQTGAELT